MLRTLLIMFLITCSLNSKAQPSDFLALKKKNGITIKSYFPGTTIDFFTSSGAEVNGIIRKIDKDTIFLSFHDVRMLYNRWGTASPDTLFTYDLRYSYKDIVAIARETGGLEFVRDGTIFIIGGAAYTTLHLVNSGIQHQPVNWKTVGIAMGVAAVGVVMKLLRKHSYNIGNKYRLEYIPMK